MAPMPPDHEYHLSDSTGGERSGPLFLQCLSCVLPSKG